MKLIFFVVVVKLIGLSPFLAVELQKQSPRYDTVWQAFEIQQPEKWSRFVSCIYSCSIYPLVCLIWHSLRSRPLVFSIALSKAGVLGHIPEHINYLPSWRLRRAQLISAGREPEVPPDSGIRSGGCLRIYFSLLQWLTPTNLAGGVIFSINKQMPFIKWINF